MLFDRPEPPWPEHDCSGGIGGSGFSGSEAIDVLRANGLPIAAGIWGKVFPPSATREQTPRSTPPEIMRAVEPVGGERRPLLALVRELLTKTNLTDRVSALGGIGAKLLHLPKSPLWQVTLVVNSERPNLSYTCVLPQHLGLPKNAKDKMIFAQIEGRVAGGHAIWLVTDIRLV